MGKVFGISSNATYGRRIFPLMLALLACLIWASAAQAQEAPFNSQYDPPPTTPPPSTPPPSECGGDGSGASGSAAAAIDPGASGGSGAAGDSEGASGGDDPNGGCGPQVLSDTEGSVDLPAAESPAGLPAAESPVEILPTTGGFFLAPVFLGLAIVVGAGVAAVRKKRR